MSVPSTAVCKERLTVFFYSTNDQYDPLVSHGSNISSQTLCNIPRQLWCFTFISSGLHARIGMERVSLTSTIFVKPKCCQLMLGRITWGSWYSASCERHLSIHQCSILIRLSKNIHLANSQRHSLTASRHNTRATTLLTSRSVFSPCWELILC
jgi:hypothetical protein